MFIAALFIIAKIWKQPKCPTIDNWIKKCDTYIQWNTILPLKKRIKSYHATKWMDPTGINSK